ncbi:hypothetical protein VTK73DRAFT_6409 [Phialemonium thermophilum]|uniref:Uncharacterized protein n=1 Tax=Phialemonium thermophilum TaxID=223376 RepID=A0ABR3WJN4_9PEZI
MATITVTEKVPETGRDDSLAAPSPTISHDVVAEKGLARASDVSTPSTVHQGNPFDVDLEASVTPDESCLRTSTQRIRDGTDCQVWPSQDQWRQKAKAAKKKGRSCTCLAGLSKRNRIIVKVLIILLIIGIAVGVGVGVSKPLGAGIWHGR